MAAAYCVKCRSDRELANGKLVMTKNNRPMMKGECPVCGTSMQVFGRPKP